MTATTVIKSLTVAPASSLGVLNALGLSAAGVYQLRIYVPDQSNLAISDSTWPTDPAAYVPAQEPVVIDSVKVTTIATDDIFCVNAGARAVTFVAMGWLRQLSRGSGHMRKLQDPEIGARVERLTVVGIERTPPEPTKPSGCRGVRVRCDCGSGEFVVRLKDWTDGKVKSCSCLRNELASERMLARTPEQLRAAGLRLARQNWPDGNGLSRHPLRGTHQQMMARCYNPRHISYPRYGGRQPYPITVCSRWHDPAAFIEDIERLLGPRPDGCTLDRKRNGLGYKSSNVRWADQSTQNANRGKSWWEMTVAEQLVVVW